MLLFKSESEAKLPENMKIFPICDLFVIKRDKFQITRIFLVSADETMTSIFQKGLSFKTRPFAVPFTVG